MGLQMRFHDSSGVPVYLRVEVLVSASGRRFGCAWLLGDTSTPLVISLARSLRLLGEKYVIERL
jgi:hypothetical protein